MFDVSNWDSNLVPPVGKSEALLFESTRSVHNLNQSETSVRMLEEN
jgi:hypothetical protein